ncbi:MAG: PDZ domain-containing protein [Saprospiraceae bacterium]|nr:PDZ domain-containing protein [Saprospiraceae bacterium]
MKKIFPIPMLAFLLLNPLFAQSGGTSFENKWEHLTDRVENLAERIESKTEVKAALWESRAERIGAQAERVGERWEARWNKGWPVNLNELGHEISFAICPEVAFLGIESLNISFEKAEKLGFQNHYGSYVTKVMAESSAALAGLQAFDYIYGVDEQRTSDNQNLSDILEDFQPGDEITLHFIRKGEKMTVQVKLTDYNPNFYDTDTDQPFLGVSPSEDENDEDFDGVAVDIVEKSTAEEMGLKIGDVITSINGYPVLDWEDVTIAVQNTKPGEAIEVNFLRDEKALSAKGTVKAYETVYPNNDHGKWNLGIDWGEMDKLGSILADDWEQEEEQDENRAFIGIYTEMISAEKAKRLGFDNQFGAYITGIIPNSGAERAGLMPFDYIYGFDEYRVGAEQHLGIIMKKFNPSQTVTVHFIRKGQKSKAPITFTTPFTVEKAEMNSCQDPFLGIIKGGTVNADGILISPVKGSTATELGLQEGDVLTHINGYRMVDWEDVTNAIDMLKPGETIVVDFLRAGNVMKASKPIKSYAQTKNCSDCDCGGRTTVVIATVPSISNGRGWEDNIAITSTTPRVNVENVNAFFDGISADESNSLRSKGVQLSSGNSLPVENLGLVPDNQTGFFNLTFSLSSGGNTVVRIYNLTGRVLYEYDMGNFSGNFSDSVDISQNGVGNYFLEITQKGKVFTKKIRLSKD